MKRIFYIKIALAAAVFSLAAQSYAKSVANSWTDEMTDEKKATVHVRSEDMLGERELCLRFTLSDVDGIAALENTVVFLSIYTAKSPVESVEAYARFDKDPAIALTCSKSFHAGYLLFFDNPEELLKRIWSAKSLFIKCQDETIRFDLSDMADTIYNAGIRKVVKCLGKPGDYIAPCRYCGKPRFKAEHRIELSKCVSCSRERGAAAELKRLCPDCLPEATGVKATVKGFKLVKCESCGAPAKWIAE